MAKTALKNKAARSRSTLCAHTRAASVADAPIPSTVNSACAESACARWPLLVNSQVSKRQAGKNTTSKVRRGNHGEEGLRPECL